MKLSNIFESDRYGIKDYPHKKEDLIDIYNYILDYYNIDTNSIGIEDFIFTANVIDFSELVPEIQELIKKYKLDSADTDRIQQINKSIDPTYPIYVHENHIIAGTHRAIIYLLNGIKSPNIYDVSIDENNFEGSEDYF